MKLIHFLTRVSRDPLNLLQIADSIKSAIKDSQFIIKWHLMFDINSIKNIDTNILMTLYDTCDIKCHFLKSNNDYLHPQLSDVIDSIDSGYIGILDDDNILHQNLLVELSKHIDSNGEDFAYVYNQKVDRKDFSGLDVRLALPENMKVGGVDSAQCVIPHNMFICRFDSEYVGDSRLIEALYKEFPNRFIFIDKILCYYNYIKPKKKLPTVPRILYIGNGKPKMESFRWLGYEDVRLNVLYKQDDLDIEKTIINYKPDAIISYIGDFKKLNKLCSLPLDIRRRWVNVHKDDYDRIGEIAYNVAMNYILTSDYSMLVSYFTPVYNTGNALYDVYDSLKNQTYTNWEWVIVNDSTDNGKTLKIAEEIASNDFRVKVYDFKEKSGGIIGNVKYQAACLCRGEILAELDHDDLLTLNCTEDLINASLAFPECGFFYGDSVELGRNRESLTYPDGFCFGYGSYRTEVYNGFEVKVANTANINPITIRHIVGVPNHIRAWRRNVYFQTGGHNRLLSIADDYELIVRTFLITKFCKIPKLTYIQNIYNDDGGSNTHETTRADIQRRVRTIMWHYNDAIKKRFDELGLIDWVYDGTSTNINNHTPKFGLDEQIANMVFTDA